MTDENDTFAKEAFAELDAWEQEQGEDFAEVQKILTGATGRTKTTTLRLGNQKVEIQHVAAFTLEMRGEMTAAGQSAQDMSLGLVERNRPLYEILAKICLNKPWNDWHAWAIIDVKTGETNNIFEQIVEKVLGTEEKIARFRAGR